MLKSTSELGGVLMYSNNAGSKTEKMRGIGSSFCPLQKWKYDGFVMNTWPVL